MRIWGALAALSAAALGIAGCADNPHHLNMHYLDKFATKDPTVAYFTVCRGFHCADKLPASLTQEQWKRVAAIFKPRAKDARAERAQIARAVALVERYVGPQVGIAEKQWTHKYMLVWPNLGDLTQIDCVDAAVNTWTYMTMMERAGLFSFHSVAQLSYAGSFTDPDLRNTAVLQENGGAYYAIDASLVDHGVPPLVMPLTVWLDTWPPSKSQIEHVALVEEAPAGARR
jgi:hypothetical protein